MRGHTRILLGCALVLGGMVLQGTACRITRLRNPPPVSFEAKRPVTVEEAILGAMKDLGWVSEKESPGVIVGMLHVADHMAKVRVTYSAASYKITYLASDNLNYSREANGEEKIHGAYNAWVDDLARKINSRLDISGRSDEGD
jgi:hypothetical protein